MPCPSHACAIERIAWDAQARLGPCKGPKKMQTVKGPSTVGKPMKMDEPKTKGK